MREELTWFQVAELGERPHLQMLQVKGVRLPVRQISNHVFIHRADAAELHQRPKQQRDLRERTGTLLSSRNAMEKTAAAAAAGSDTCDS